MSDEYLTGYVERLSSSGAGAVHFEAERRFVHGCVPGETVVCRVDRSEKYSAGLVDIIRASPDRTTPNCQYYGVCGGCSLRHLDYNAQLREKAALLKAAFKHSGGISLLPEIKITLSAPDGYRNRASFHRVGTGRAIGFMARDSKTPVQINDCPVLEATLRAAQKDGVLIPPLDRDRFTVYGRGGTLLSEGSHSMGAVNFSAEGCAETIFLDAGLFFQSNGLLLEQLITRLLALARQYSGELAGDFYAGVGTFAVFLRRVFSKIDVLEQNRAAIEIARKNLSGGGLRFYAQSDSDWVKNIGGKPRRYDFLCVDPGRAGLSPLMRSWLCKNQPALLAYVSCEASALARDARALLSGGLELVSLEIFDFYPQTARLETLAVFTGKQN
ncbi:MAG: class I SAM-dependent RNA methyltransferase [Spirochaetaceae bacterium]|jgi:23S rRNA (uracil1939-C5)-methyltransferase|nr:class I SAM-dependent RNA methyltransferase [Spirochaetaceae bacterium]